MNRFGVNIAREEERAKGTLRVCALFPFYFTSPCTISSKITVPAITKGNITVHFGSHFILPFYAHISVQFFPIGGGGGRAHYRMISLFVPCLPLFLMNTDHSLLDGA